MQDRAIEQKNPTETQNQSNSSTNVALKDLFHHSLLNSLQKELLATPSHLTVTQNNFPKIILSEADRLDIFEQKENLLNKLGFKIIDRSNPGEKVDKTYLLQPPANTENFSLKGGARGGKRTDTIVSLNDIEVFTIRHINEYGYHYYCFFLEDEKKIDKALYKNMSNELGLSK